MKRAFCLVLLLMLLCEPALADLKLPEGVRVIEPYAFYGDDAVERVILPRTLKEIRAMAFADSGLKEINLPGSLTFIASNAFDGCEDLVVKVPANSYPLVWARGRNVPYVIDESYRSEYGTIVGTITLGDEGAAGVKVYLWRNGVVVASAETESDGSYLFTDVLEGDYTIRTSKQGYASFSENVSVYGGETAYSDPIGLLDSATAGEGTVSGHVTNGFTKAALAGAHVTARAGWNNQDTGAIVASAETDANGDYTLQLPQGYYTITVEVGGFVLSSTNVSALGNQAVTARDVASIPVAQEDEYRVRLSWDAVPRDLDAHMQGTTPSGAGFHVYYKGDSMKAYDNGQLICNLDVDDTDSYGPEVITLKDAGNGPCYYYVHNYSGEDSLAASGASVSLYKGSTLVRTFQIPKNAGSDRNWNVFSIQDGEIVVRNTVTTEADTSYTGDSQQAEEEDEDENATLTWSDGTTVRDEADVPSTSSLWSISFKSDNPWSMQTPDWVTPTKKNGPAGAYSMLLGIGKNTGAAREGDVVISSQQTKPLVLHISQAGGGASLAFDLSLDRLFDDDGVTHGRMTLTVSNEDDADIFTAKNIVIRTTLPENMESEELSSAITIAGMVEDLPTFRDFGLQFKPSVNQYNYLDEDDEPVPQRMVLRMRIDTDNCGAYEYETTLEATPAIRHGDSFEMFLAYHIIDESNFLYDLRTFVPVFIMEAQPLKASEKFQRYLAEWRLLTFNGASEIQYADNELDYYRAMLYTILYDRGEEPDLPNTIDAVDILDDMSSFIDDYELADGSFGALNSFVYSVSKLSGETADIYKKGFLDFLSVVRANDEMGTLRERYQKYAPMAKVADKMGIVSTAFDAALTVAEVMKRVQEVEHLDRLTNEKRALLQGIREQGSGNLALQAAVNEYLDLYPDLDGHVVNAIIVGQETAYTIAKSASTAAYLTISTKAPLAALVLAEGKLLSNYFFNTNDILKAYYECEASWKMEIILKSEVEDAYNTFLLEPSDEHARMFLTAVDAFYRNRAKGGLAADSLAKACLTDDESINVLGLVEVPVNTIKLAMQRALNADYAEEYQQFHTKIESQRTYDASFLSSQRSAAIRNYYYTTRLSETGEGTLKRVD